MQISGRIFTVERRMFCRNIHCVCFSAWVRCGDYMEKRKIMNLMLSDTDMAVGNIVDSLRGLGIQHMDYFPLDRPSFQPERCCRTKAQLACLVRRNFDELLDAKGKSNEKKTHTNFKSSSVENKFFFARKTKPTRAK